MPDTDPLIQDSATRYWTPGRLIAGLLMAVTAVTVVVYVQWDDVQQIARADQAYGPRTASRQVFDMSNLQLPKERIFSGGPRKDGIPSLTDPKVVPVTEADFLDDNDRVVGVTINGQHRAYPIRVLNYHECYNDTLAGVPIAIVFCPLCDSVTVVDRRLDGKTYEFGISGMLFNSNVLLYDRTDDALWSQVGFKAISGPNAGKSLKHLDGWALTPFANWRSEHPDSTVATFDTGHPRNYERTPYASYFQTDEVMFPVEPTDNRFLNKTPVIGILVGDTAKAYPVDAIVNAPNGRVQDTIAGQQVILEATGSPPSVRVIETPDASQVVHTFWFAWYAFHPDTAVYTTGG